MKMAKQARAKVLFIEYLILSVRLVAAESIAEAIKFGPRIRAGGVRRDPQTDLRGLRPQR
jgi:hypothetical protein